VEYAEHEIDLSWHTRDCSLCHIINIDNDRSSLLQVLVDAHDLSKGEINKGICTKIYRAHLWSTWSNPKELLSPKLQHYSNFYHQCSDGLIYPPRYTRLYLSCSTRVPLTQLRVFCHCLHWDKSPYYSRALYFPDLLLRSLHRGPLYILILSLQWDQRMALLSLWRFTWFALNTHGLWELEMLHPLPPRDV